MFKCIYEDNPGGKYIKRCGLGRYHFIEWTDMDDACGRDNEGQPRYSVDLSEVDLYAVTNDIIESAIKSCGWEGSSIENSEHLAEMLHSYGARAPIFDKVGNNLRQLMKAARAESKRLNDPDERNAALHRPVNQLGSTALEFMQGDLGSAIDRGCRAGKANAQIMAKMYGVEQSVIEAVKGYELMTAPIFRFDLYRVDSPDPIPFSTGYMLGVSGQPLDANRKGYSEEYFKGYRLGVAVRKGEQQKPDWVKG